MKTCDFVITNPPFESKVFKPLFLFLKTNNIQYILWAGLGQVGFANDTYIYMPNNNFRFTYLRKDGSLATVRTIILTSFKPPVLCEHNTKYDNEDIIPLTSVMWYSKDEYHFIFNFRETPNSFPKVMKIKKNKEQGE